MASGGRDLYRWKRWSGKSQSAVPVTKKPANVDDIESWLKKVEQASDEAAAITFGRPKRTNYQSNGHEGAMATIDALKDHDAAYTEAQDLLTQWMAEKCDLGDDDDIYLHGDDDYSSASKPSTKTDLQNHWEQLLDENDPGMLHTYQGPSSDVVYHEIESRDDDRTVQQILNDLLDKDMGETKVKRDLGLDRDMKKKKDPTVTMAARQQKVKENRERKERDRRRALEEKQVQKETQLKARQMVKQEEKVRAIKVQQEEQKIQQEMAKIRKQLQETRQREEEERNRRQLAEEAARLQVEREAAARKESEARQRMEAERELERQKTVLMRREVERQEREESDRIKCKHRHIQAWYQLVLDRRIKTGKVRALSDWRCLLRSWNAWRAYHRACIAERESREAEEFVRESHRRNNAARSHYRHHLLHKYFISWRIWMSSAEEAAKIEEVKLKTRNKMDAFLEAAASGRLWTDRSGASEESLQERNSRPSGKKPSSVPPSPRSAVSSSPHQSIRSQPPRSHGGHLTKPPKPKHAWQITRKHLKLTTEEMAHVGEETDRNPNRNQNNENMHLDLRFVDESADSTVSRRKEGLKVNNFEHRYANQQKMLLEQKEQLVEQKKLIEDLQSAQREQLIKMQLSAIQNGGGVPGARSGTNGSANGMKDTSSASTERSETMSATSTPSSGASGKTVTTNRTDSTATTDRTASTATTNRTASGRKTASQPALLKGMEERAATRARMKAEREERMRKKEEEKLAHMRAEEEQKTAEEERKKQEEIEGRRERKKLEKQKELEKKQRLEKVAEMNSRADQHYRRSLMRNLGLDPWKKLVTSVHQRWQLAVDHHGDSLQRRCLLPWHQLTQDIKREKCEVADENYRVILLQRSLNSWKRYGHYLSIQYQRARRHYATQTRSRLFRAWQEFTTNEKLAVWRNEEMATDHSRKRMMRTVFLAWKKYPKMLKQERGRERRRKEMRKKVSSLLPDFGQ